MRTKTDIANSALAYLSATSIDDIDDIDDEKARSIKSVFDTVAMEIAREHRWSCLIRRAELVKDVTEPLRHGNFGYRSQFNLPADCLRFLDLNGEPYKAKTEFMDLNGRKLLANCDQAFIRYVAWIDDPAEWDVKFAEVVAVKLAMRIARRITKDGISSEDLYGIYQRILKSAQAIDAMEVGSGENSPLERMMERSPLVNAGRQASSSRGQILGWNVDLQEPR